MIDFTDYMITFPARIVNFYPETQLADIQISAELLYNNNDNLDNLGTRQVIEKVPVHTPYGGGWSVTFPIVAGDTCLIIFSQIGYDHWLYEDKDTGGMIENSPKPHLNRVFNENDGFALVGFNTLPRAIESYSSTDSEWRNSDRTQRISLEAGGRIVIDSTTDVDILADTDVSITAPTVTITGTVNVTGEINLNGIALSTHVHSGVTTGGSNTGGPV